MEMKFELRANEEEQSWSLRIDGNEWENGISTEEVYRLVRFHVRATMDVITAEIVGDDISDWPNDEVKSCPECGRPNQFGQLCGYCRSDELEGRMRGDFADRDFALNGTLEGC